MALTGLDRSTARHCEHPPSLNAVGNAGHEASESNPLEDVFLRDALVV